MGKVSAIAKKLESAWGFAFPDDLFAVWDVARAVARKYPRDAFLDLIGVRLEGPFDVLDGGKVAKDRGRWASDPPEFFSIASGNTDGLHWGYVVHDPGKTDPVCAHFYASDGYPITIGTTLFEALRGWLEDVREEKVEELAHTESVGERDRELAAEVKACDRAIAIFRAHRAPRKPKKVKTFGATLDGLGALCTKDQWAPSNEKKPETKLAAARKMLERGKPGGALVIARNAYARLPQRHQTPARELLAEIYVALGRPALAAALGARVASPKPKKGPRRCDSFAEALEGDLASIEVLAIGWPDRDEPKPRKEHWAAMKNLKSLSVCGIALDLPPSFAKLKLRELEVRECTPRKLPRVMTRISTIEELELLGMRLPNDWKLPKLGKAMLYECGLKKIPSFVLRAKKTFYSLGISESPIDEIPEAFGELKRLSYFSLTETRVRELPDVFAGMKRLDSAWLDRNRLTRLPDSLLKKKLESLSIGRNPLVKDKAERARIKKMLPKTKIYWT